jgi:C-terminal peptidase prc
MPTATSLPTSTPTPTVPLLTPTATLVPLSSEERVQIFEDVWSHVRDNYVYRDYRGLDWPAVRAEYLPKVRDAETIDTFYGLMSELIRKLGDDHSRFESPQDVAEEQVQFDGQLNYVGIGAMIRDVPEGGLVTRLAPGGPAELAGLQPHDLIIAVQGIPFTDTAKFGPHGPRGLIRSQGDPLVTLTVQTLNQPPREVQIVRKVIPPDAFPNVEVQRLPGTQVGYLLLDTFNRADVDQLVEANLRDLLSGGPLTGLIIDVRDNSGGQVHLMLNTIGLFYDGGSIGYTQGTRQRSELLVPRGRMIEGLKNVPLTVLISEDTVSAGEIFASGMQTLGIAKIVGVPSAGNTENLLAEDFRDGSRVWLAELLFYRPDGSLIEGKGVQPDQEVRAEWWRFSLPEDPYVQASLTMFASK